jgi:adenylate cyclase
MRLLTSLLQLFSAGHGRPFAAAMLAGFSLLLFLPNTGPFKTLRLSLFDAYQTHMPRERVSAPAVIVGIDEASLKALGQWPWPRTRLAALIESIAACKPAAIGLDIIMPEPDRMSPVQLAASLPQIDPALRQRLSKLPDNDSVLAVTLARTPSVLGAAGFNYPTPATTNTLHATPIAVRGGEAVLFVQHFPAVLKSQPALEKAASGQGLLNVDLEKGVVRRMPLIAVVGETLVPSLAIELLRVASGLPVIEVTVGARGILNAGLSDVLVPTQPNGEAWVHFTPSLTDRYISAVDVLAGRVNPEKLHQKLVLVGATALGLADVVTTPLGERVPGIEVHAQLLENIFEQSFLTRPSWMIWVEWAVLLVCGILILIAVPILKPRTSTVLIVAVTGLLFACGFFLYRTSGILFDAASLSMSIDTMFASLLITTFIESDRERRAMQQSLQLEREAAALVSGEMKAAQRIQMGSLPQAATAFPGEERFYLEALMEPARVVGGDLYDFYMLDRNRLFFIIGDVSGKGLPASLFMAVTKAMAKSIALNEGLNVRTILNKVNVELARENPEMLFVTACAAILDAEQGSLEYCIAGHDAPWKIGLGGKVTRLSGEGNPALCVVEDFDYPLETEQLARGDTICVVTDGVTEAMNAAGEQYGSGRLTHLLERQDPRTAVSVLVERVRDDVGLFVSGAEQSDDLTLLIVRWEGPTAL